jgi:cyclic-di-GMP-binding protein
MAVAKDQFSFDIVSEVDPQEVRNAVNQATREVTTRFDFKGTDTSLEIDQDMIEMRSSTEDRLKAALDVLKEKLVRREISLKAIREGPVLPAARGTARQTLHVNRGISDEKAKDLVKFIKKTGTKVQTQIQGDQLRITAKKKDDLQSVIQAVKAEDFGIPLQFTNYRP